MLLVYYINSYNIFFKYYLHDELTICVKQFTLPLHTN